MLFTFDLHDIHLLLGLILNFWNTAPKQPPSNSAHGSVGRVIHENLYTTANCEIQILETWLFWTSQYVRQNYQSESMFTVRYVLDKTSCLIESLSKLKRGIFGFLLKSLSLKLACYSYYKYKVF